MNPILKPFVAGDPEYDVSKSVFNGWVRHQPAFIFRPKTKAEIIEIVRFATENKMTISVKNGGHSAYGQCISEHGITIDMSLFKKKIIAKDRKKVSVEGGVLSGELELYLSKYNVSIPLGDCPDVGVTGIALGGGNGFLSRKYGLTCDLIANIELVTFDGHVINVSATKHQELFWALKGAGQNNFGIVTKISFNVIPLPQSVFVFDYFWPLDQAQQVISQTIELLENYPRALALYMRVNREFQNKPCIRVYGIYQDSEETANKINEHLQNAGTPLQSNFYSTSYYQAQQINASSVTPNISFHWDNAILYRSVTADDINKIIQWFTKCPSDMCRINLDPLGGQIGEISSSESAFVHRNGQYILSVIGVWSGNENNMKIRSWTTQCFNDLMAGNETTSYQNYTGYNYRVEKYFGEQLNKLNALKQKWDPNDIFEGLLS